MSKRAARRRRGSAILTRAPTGPCQIRTKIAESAWASGRGGARDPRARRARPARWRSPPRPAPRARRRRPRAHRRRPSRRSRRRARRGAPPPRGIPRPTSSGSPPNCSSQSSSAAVAVTVRVRRTPALEPVDLSRRDAGGAAQVAQQVGRLAGAEQRLQQRHERAADGGRPGRDLGLERDRDAAGLEHGREQRAAAGRVADDDRDLLRLDPVGEQPRHLGRDRLGLAALARRAQEDEAVVGRHPLRLGGPEPALEVEEERRLRGVLGVRVELLGVVDADLGEALEQRSRPLLEHRVPRLVGEGDGDLGDGGERPDQVELVAGQVVEAVDEDRPRHHRRRRRPAARSPRGRRRAVSTRPRRSRTAAYPANRVGDVAEVGGALQRRPPPPPRAAGSRPAPCSSSSRCSSATGKPGCEAEPRSGRSPGRCSAIGRRHRAEALGRRQAGAGRRAARRRHRPRRARRRSSPRRPAPPRRRRARAGSGRRRRRSARPARVRGPARRSAARRIRPARPEFGGPWISFSGIAFPAYVRPAARRPPQTAASSRPDLPSSALSTLTRRWLSAS